MLCTIYFPFLPKHAENETVPASLHRHQVAVMWLWRAFISAVERGLKKSREVSWTDQQQQLDHGDIFICLLLSFFFLSPPSEQFIFRDFFYRNTFKAQLKQVEYSFTQGLIVPNIIRGFFYWENVPENVTRKIYCTPQKEFSLWLPSGGGKTERSLTVWKESGHSARPKARKAANPECYTVSIFETLCNKPSFR